MTELLPCPFCGGEPIITGRQIGCGSEHCVMTSVWVKADSLACATECWNTRVVDAKSPSTDSAKAVGEPVAWYIPDDEGRVVRTTGYCGEAFNWKCKGHEVLALYATPSPISDQAAGDTREARLEKLMSVLDVFIAKQDEEWRYANRDLTMAFVDVVFAKDTAPTTGSAPEPVAWRAPNCSGSGDDWAYRDADDRFEDVRGNLVGEPLYLRPASPAASVLSEDAILAIAIDHGLGTAVVESIVKALPKAMGGDKS